MNEDKQTRIIKKLYGSLFGGLILKIITRPWVSKLAGAFMDSRASIALINSFKKQNRIDMSQYETCRYRSFNEFFTRRIKPELRPISDKSNELVSPSDGRLSIYPISKDKRVTIKGQRYSMEELVRDRRLAEKYEGGIMLVFRLTVTDYHRYHYPDGGMKRQNNRIDGVLHTVNPIAAKARKIYCENSREYFTIESDNFGELLFIQVGATLVGKICNLHGVQRVEKGQEAGCFKYGGSTVILCVEQDKIELMPELCTGILKDEEIPVIMGQVVAHAK